MIILMIMNDSKRWRTMMKRLAYLRAEASEAVELFEESVKEIKEKVGEAEETEVEPVSPPAASPSTSKEMITMAYVVIDETHSEWKERRKKYEPPKPESPKDVEEERVVAVPEDDELKPHYKRLWRVVARLTHPDVSGNDPEMTLLYKAAASAHEKDKREELLDVAAEVNAQLESPHEKMLEDIARRCSHYEQMIKKIRDSVAWQWKHAQEGTKKEIVELIKSKREEKDKA